VRISVVSAPDTTSKRVAQDAQRVLQGRPREVTVRQDLGPPQPDLVIAIGDSGFFLDTLRDAPAGVPVFTVGLGFLAEAPPEALPAALSRLVSGRHSVEERLRLDVDLEGRHLPPALNEVALTSSRGAGFLRYSLEVDGERIWRDGGDGVVISTPTGSTGYGLSAGGPVVMENADTIVVVPICSASGQRPLVLPRSSEVAVRDVESRLGRVVVLDGRKRYRVRPEGFTVRAAKDPARFVRIGKARYLQALGKLHAKQHTRRLPYDAAPSAKFLYRLLGDHGALTEKQLVAESGLPERTVRASLSFLVRAEFARRVASLRDAREAVFAVRPPPGAR
jgi:NAD+ kinase